MSSRLSPLRHTLGSTLLVSPVPGRVTESTDRPQVHVTLRDTSPGTPGVGPLPVGGPVDGSSVTLGVRRTHGPVGER